MKRFLDSKLTKFVFLGVAIIALFVVNNNLKRTPLRSLAAPIDDEFGGYISPRPHSPFAFSGNDAFAFSFQDNPAGDEFAGYGDRAGGILNTGIGAGDCDFCTDLFYIEDDDSGGAFIAYGDGFQGTNGTWDIYITHVNAAGAETAGFPVQITTSVFYNLDWVHKMLHDGSGGVFVLYTTISGSPFGFVGGGTRITHMNSAGVVSYDTAIGGAGEADMVGGFGDAYVITDMDIDDITFAQGQGLVTHWTSAGQDATFNGGTGSQVVSTNTTSTKTGFIAAPNGFNGALIYWIDDESGEEGLYFNGVGGTGSSLGDSPRGDLLYAATNLTGSIRATGNFYGGATIAFETSDDELLVFRHDVFGAAPYSAWPCIQRPVASGFSGDFYDFDVIDHFGDVFVTWEGDSAGDRGLWAQNYDIGTGVSQWALAGQLVDDAVSNGGTDFQIYLHQPTGSVGTGIANRQTRGSGTTWFGNGIDEGFQAIFDYEVAAGDREIFTTTATRSTYTAGPGGDCASGVLPPQLISPDDEQVLSTTSPTLSARYRNDFNTGETNYRVATTNGADCLSGANLIDSGTSPTTSAATEATTFSPSGLIDGNTYHWCAQNQSGGNMSAWTTMGEFTVDTTAPAADYSTFIGGTTFEDAASIYVSSNDIFITGRTSSSDFPTSSGAFDETSNGSNDGFVFRLSPDAAGTADRVWATYLGGSSGEEPQGISVDGTATVVVGTTTSTNFPTNGGGGTAFDTTHNGGDDGFISVLDTATGASLSYSTFIGGTGSDEFEEVFTQSGMIFVVGDSNNASFPTTTGAFDETHNGSGDIVMLQFNPLGGGSTDLVYSTFLGSSSNERGKDVAYNGSDIAIIGTSFGSGYPTTSGSFDETHNGDTDTVFTAIFPGGGGAGDITYSAYIGGSNDDTAESFAFDSDEFFIVGETESSNFPVSGGSFQDTKPTSDGTDDGFIFGLTLSGEGGSSDRLYATFFGGAEGGDRLDDVAYDGGNIYVAGQASSSNLPTTTNAVDRTYNGSNDVFIAQLNAGGAGSADLDYSTFYGGTSVDNVFDLFLNGQELWFTGDTLSSDYPVGATAGTAFDETYNGNRDAYITRINFAGGGGGGPTVPAAVIDLAATPGDTQVGLNWSAPADGGSPITDYTVEFGATAGFPGNAAVFADGVSAIPGATVTGLTNGTNYSFRVFAINGVGTGPSSNVATATPASSGGGGGSPAQLTQSLVAPTIVSTEVRGTDTIRYTWDYTGSNHLGFRIVDGSSTQLTDIADTAARTWDESGLPHNTEFTDRRVKAYNTLTESGLSEIWLPAVTEIIPLNPVLVSRVGTTIEITADQLPNNLEQGQSGVQFELVNPAEVTAAGVTVTEWQKQLSNAFLDIPLTDDVQVRMRARNQVGVETVWSDYLFIPGVEQLPAQLAIGLSITTINGAPVPEPVDPNQILFGTITVENPGEMIARDVFVTLPIPEFLQNVPGSLRIGGDIQSDGADTDSGQLTSNSVSAIFAELMPSESRTLTFQLAFDLPALELLTKEEELERGIQEFIETELDQSFELRETGQFLAAVSVLASAVNPTITLQASVSASNVANPAFSNPVQVQPDLSIFAPVPPAPPAPPIPTPTPTPTPVPVPPAPPAPIPTPIPTPTPPAGGGGDDLFLTGNAQSAQEEIEFTGTTSKPNSTITVVFNDLVTKTVTSDENGVWTTFVNADALGIKPGETATVEITGIAKKDDLTSNTVIQNVVVTRAIEGEVLLEVEPTVSDSSIIQVIEESEEEIITTLTVGIPLIFASSAPLWGYLPYLPSLLYHFITWLIGLIRKKKEGQLFGIVYDSITKQPMSLAIVRVYSKEDGKLVKTQVTDKEGRYEFLLEPGEYRIEARKPAYLFPSKIVTTPIDGEYQHVYQVQKGLHVDETSLSLPDLPIDPENAKRKFKLSNVFKKLGLAIQAAGHYLAIPMLFIGALISVITLILLPNNPINWILAIIYVLMLVLQLIFREHRERAWGIVYEVATNAAVPLATIQLIDPEFGKIVKSRLSDYEGRFSFLPDPGKYKIQAAKQGFEQTEVVEGQKNRKPIAGDVEIQKKDERITGDIPLRQI